MTRVRFYITLTYDFPFSSVPPFKILDVILNAAEGAASDGLIGAADLVSGGVHYEIEKEGTLTTGGYTGHAEKAGA